MFTRRGGSSPFRMHIPSYIPAIFTSDQRQETSDDCINRHYSIPEENDGCRFQQYLPETIRVGCGEGMFVVCAYWRRISSPPRMAAKIEQTG
jgi:hypothetical protein